MTYYDYENKEMRTLGSMRSVVDRYFEEKRDRFDWDLADYPLIGEGRRVDEEVLV